MTRGTITRTIMTDMLGTTTRTRITTRMTIRTAVTGTRMSTGLRAG